MFLQWASKCVVFCNVSNSCRFKFILKLNCGPILVIEGLKSIVQFHFFLNNTGELYHFIKKKEFKTLQGGPRSKTPKKYRHNCATHNKRKWPKQKEPGQARNPTNRVRNRPRAELLARHHKLPSCSTARHTSATHGWVPLNTQAFPCFQISQATRIIKELSPFFISLGAWPTNCLWPLARKTPPYRLRNEDGQTNLIIVQFHFGEALFHNL